jgi:hypothetical protein
MEFGLAGLIEQHHKWLFQKDVAEIADEERCGNADGIR